MIALAATITFMRLRFKKALLANFDLMNMKNAARSNNYLEF